MEANPFQRVLDAVKSGDSAAVHDLLSVHADVARQSDDCGWSLLHYAASKGIADAAEAIIGLGGDVGARDGSGATPLHYAAEEGNGVVAVLLSHGADANARDDHGMTPLHWLAREGDDRHGTADLLPRGGADPLIRDADGRLAADLAERNGSHSIAELLRGGTAI